MLYQVLDDSGTPLDAHFQINGSSVLFLSRGGTKSKNARNTDYGQALKLLLKRLAASNTAVMGAWVDSSQVQNLPLKDREVWHQHEDALPYDEVFRRITSRMKAVGQDDLTLKNGGGNSTRKLRIDLDAAIPEGRIAELLGGMPTTTDMRSLDRLPVADLEKITAEHVWRAVQLLISGYGKHLFGTSTDYDLIADNDVRLPPKAVFGVAASDALGFEVMPRHFTGGEGSPCFRILRASGYMIVPKDASTTEQELPAPSEDLAWSEGSPKLVSHLKRERAPGLAKAKKVEFKRVHGKLFCERCNTDPVAKYGADVGEACIEVHHKSVQVKDMISGHKTTLADLQCLCANCHRVEHALLKLQKE